MRKMKKHIQIITNAAAALFAACQQNKGQQSATKIETEATWTKIEPCLLARL